jgi:hypothetical protein
MAFLPYWPRRATVSYNLLAYAALWSWASFVMGLVGGSTGKWARLRGLRDAPLVALMPPRHRIPISLIPG